ncbi:MAG TPA: hypothetical protein VNU26_18480 [Mycobacteriales bacterium]|nr:hypothetical protein [Mycobacteriales bacterium]
MHAGRAGGGCTRRRSRTYALLDSDHVDHALAWSWLDAEAGDGWASCVVTENGFVRVLSQSRRAAEPRG